MRRAHICLVPFNAFGSTTQASQFALRIIEEQIITDYLRETHGIGKQLVAQIPNEEDWWDNADRKSSYPAVLSKRHKSKIKYDELIADKNIHYPDISTFNGPNVIQGAYGDFLKVPPIVYSPKRGAGRSEIYEIKPHNEDGKKDALEKLLNIENEYNRYHIGGIYKRGIKYPDKSSKQKTIPVETPYLSLFTYLVQSQLNHFDVVVVGVSIEVTQAFPGVLLYKICVDLASKNDFEYESFASMARFVIRQLMYAQTMYQKKVVIEAALALADTMVPDDPTINPSRMPWVLNNRDLRKVPYLKLNVISLVDEIRPQLEGIRAAMFSRLIGLPGDRFFICSDETWYQRNIGVPGLQKVNAQVKLLSFGSGVLTAKGSSFIGLSQPVLITADQVIDALPLIGDGYKWAKNHIRVVLIFVGCTIAVTASVLLILGTGGSATPASAAITAQAIEAATIALEAGVGTEAGIMSTAAMGAATTADVAAVSTTAPGIVVAEEQIGLNSARNLVEWAHQAAQAGSTANEINAARTAASMDELLIKAAQSTFAKKAVSAIVGAAVIGLSSQSAYASTGSINGQVAAKDLTNLLHQEVGQLFLVKAPKAVNTRILAVPESYKKFNLNDYQLKENFSEPKEVRSLRMLGCIDVL